MKKLLFMMFLLGGVAIGFSSCGEGEESSEETTEATEDEGHEEGH